MKKIIAFLTLSLFVQGASLPSASATPHCEKCPYSCQDLGLGKKDCSQVSSSGGICCVDLTQKGLDIAEARSKASSTSSSSSSPCPAGFSPGSQKCSPEQRRKGCKDLKGTDGRTCISYR